MTDRILVVEDEHDVGLAVRTLLTRSGFEVRVGATGREGLRAFHRFRPHAVVLDVGLPDLDGWQVLERVRDVSGCPVLMLTAQSTDSDIVRGLRSGADDYLTKPFSNAELVARVQALIRRARRPADEDETGRRTDVLADDVLVLDIDRRRATVAGRPVDLTPLEFRLVAALVRHRDQVLSPEQLLELAWGDPTGLAPERVKFAVLRLRRKLGDDVRFEAVRGFGYRYRS